MSELASLRGQLAVKNDLGTFVSNNTRVLQFFNCTTVLAPNGDVQVTANGGGGGGVTNGNNVGGGAEVFQGLTGSVMDFRTLIAGPNVIITQNADDITIEATTAAPVGTPNKVAFYTAVTGALNAGNTNFHFDNTNDFLGIGNAAPQARLHVGTNATSGTVGTSNIILGQVHVTANIGTGNFFAQGFQTTNTITASHCAVFGNNNSIAGVTNYLVAGVANTITGTGQDSFVTGTGNAVRAYYSIIGGQTNNVGATTNVQSSLVIGGLNTIGLVSNSTTSVYAGQSNTYNGGNGGFYGGTSMTCNSVGLSIIAGSGSTITSSSSSVIAVTGASALGAITGSHVSGSAITGTPNFTSSLIAGNTIAGGSTSVNYSVMALNASTLPGGTLNGVLAVGNDINPTSGQLYSGFIGNGLRGGNIVTQFVVGKFNKNSPLPTDRIFVVGNGNSNADRFDALFVDSTNDTNVRGGLKTLRGGTADTSGIATLPTAASIVVNTTKVAANSAILITKMNNANTGESLRVSAIVPGVSFTLTSTTGTSTAIISWLIVNAYA